MNRADFDLDFRPASYWDAADPLAAMLQNVKGQVRRDMIREFAAGGAPARLGSIEAGLTESAVDDATRAFLGSIHPIAMGGEYLPDFRRGEVEIARISLASVTGDVMSIRARRRPSGVYVYWMHDEYESRWHVRPRTSKRTLTLGQLIRLIDTAWCDDMPLGESGDLVIDLYQGAGGLPEGAGFVRVESEIYLELEEWYRMREEDEIATLEAGSEEDG